MKSPVPYIAVFTAFLLVFTPFNASAATLTKQAAESFVSSMDDVNTLAKKMEEEGKSKIFDAKNEPVPGEKFKPYTGSLVALQNEYPAEYKQLGEIVRKHGFKSQESWANVGDEVMMAYVASKMNIPAAAQMPQLTPEMMSRMPPEAIAKMEQGMAALQTMHDVPQAHKDIIAPLTPKIDAWAAAHHE